MRDHESIPAAPRSFLSELPRVVADRRGFFHRGCCPIPCRPRVSYDQDLVSHGEIDVSEPVA
jgi:hypothetical protein